MNRNPTLVIYPKNEIMISKKYSHPSVNCRIIHHSKDMEKQPSVCQQMEIYIYICIFTYSLSIHSLNNSNLLLLFIGLLKSTFLHDSVLVGCMFLEFICFFLGYPNYWHTVAHSSLYDSMHFTSHDVSFFHF